MVQNMNLEVVLAFVIFHVEDCPGLAAGRWNIGAFLREIFVVALV